MSVGQGRGRWTIAKRDRETIALMVPRRSGLRASPAAFWRLCAVNDDLRLELTFRGEVIVMPPAGADSGRRNAGLTAQLYAWNQRDRAGFVFDSSAGFTLPNGAVRAPDASWILRPRWEALAVGDRRRFAPICPDFTVELTSPKDTLSHQQAKMREYIDQGARLAWLLHPKTGLVEVYRPGREVEILDRPATLSGEHILPGFVLDLREILFD